MSALPDRPVPLDGGRVVLRAFAPDDLPDVRRALADPEVARWNPGPAGPDPAGALASGRNDWTAGGHASWAVGDRSGRLVGSVSLHHLDLDQRDSEVGCWTAPWARGRGHATDAVLTALRWAFGDLGLHRVQLYHAVENVGSCAVARRVGMVLEGTLRQSYRYADGLHHDEHLHAVLRSDPLPPGMARASPGPGPTSA